jgi:heptosyltransferase-2
MLIHTSCRQYRGHLPCSPNKLRGKECPTCDEFDPIRKRILLIKLAAPGDVLRTTALLPGIRRKWPGCEITWLTRKNAQPLLENLSLIDRVLTLEEDGGLQLLGEKFDICINLDNDPLASAIATTERAVRHLGYVLDDFGRITAANPEAQQWLNMALFDRLKKENTDTYQTLMRMILGLDPAEKDPIQIQLSGPEVMAARERLAHLGVSGHRPVAFNTGAGERWKTKRWPMERYLELGLLLTGHAAGKILLLGGPFEKEANDLLALERPDVFISAGVMPLRDFMALVAECGLLVTSDTMALHIGLGTGVPTVAMFGPTSAAEIEGFHSLLKVVSPKECTHFYQKVCDDKPCCMEEITPALVYERIKQAGWLDHLPESLAAMRGESGKPL